MIGAPKCLIGVLCGDDDVMYANDLMRGLWTLWHGKVVAFLLVLVVCTLITMYCWKLFIPKKKKKMEVLLQTDWHADSKRITYSCHGHYLGTVNLHAFSTLFQKGWPLNKEYESVISYNIFMYNSLCFSLEMFCIIINFLTVLEVDFSKKN